jgi:hypothetical protein
MRQCLQCGRDLEGKRKTAKTCSAACRTLVSRRKLWARKIAQKAIEPKDWRLCSAPGCTRPKRLRSRYCSDGCRFAAARFRKRCCPRCGWQPEVNP